MAGIHVLLVDDDENVVALLEKFLHLRGDLCRTASSGEEALQLLRTDDFDVLLTDLWMPGLNGLELITAARTLRPEMACVLMSGGGTRGDIITALKIGVHDFLDKPFRDHNSVTFVLERAAEWSRLRRERASMLAHLQSQNAMLESSLGRLRTAYARLAEQEETLAADLLQAQHVQRKLLPHAFPQLNGIELFGFFGPCEGLGGDFFGTIRLADGKLGIYLADVVGHGVRAAMITVILRELMNTRRQLDPRVATFESPSSTLEFLNGALREEAFDPPILVSMVYAVIDPKTGRVNVATAGHPAPVRVTSGGESSLLSAVGPMLATSNSAHFEAHETLLEPGDFLLLYSDGLSEARNPEGGEFTASRLREITARLAERPAAEIGAAVESRIVNHLAGNPPSDDMTFIVINRREAGAAEAASSVKIVLPHEITRARHNVRGVLEAGWSATTCVIRLHGVGTWQVASALSDLIARAEEKRASIICLDLATCEGMDSTLLGLLYQWAAKLELHQPSEHLKKQFREIGIFDQLRISETAAPVIETEMAIAPSDGSKSLIRTAHESLVNVSEENRARFQHVIEALNQPHEAGT